MDDAPVILRPQVKPNLALQVMRGRNKSPNASGQWSSKSMPADGSSASLALGVDGAQLPQQPTTPTATEHYAQFTQHSRASGNRTRTTRHSTSGLPCFGQQQNVNGSIDPVPQLSLLKGRSSSSRGLDCQVLVEDHAGEQVRPSGTLRILQPSNLRVSPAATPAAVRDPPYPSSHLPDSSSLQSSLPLSSRRPSLLRTSSANSNSAATTLWSHSHTLPNITSPGGSGAAAAAAVFHSHPPASPAQQPQPYSLSSAGPVGFTSPMSPVPPASPRVPQSSLGIRRGHLPPPIVSSSAWMCPSPGGGASPAALSPGVMSRSSNSFRARLLNFREVAPPTSPSSSASSSAPLVKSAPWRGNATFPNDDDPGASQHELRNHTHHSRHFTPLPPQPVAHDPSPQSCEDGDFQQFRSAPLPLETPNGLAASLDDAIVDGGAPPPVTLPGRTFRRNVVLRSASLGTQSQNPTVDEWIEAHVGGVVGGTDVISRSPAVAPPANATSSSAAAATRSSLPQATIWEGASLAVGCGAGPRRTHSDWGAKLVSCDMISDSSVAAAVGAGVVADSGSYAPGGDSFTLRDLTYGIAPRRAATSVSGSGLYGSARHLGTEDVRRNPHQHHHNAAGHSVPGCVSRLRLFEGAEALYTQEEMDEAISDAEDDASEEADYDSDTTIDIKATVSAGQKGSVAVEFAHLNQILDPMLDVLDPGRLVARRCMQRLQNGTNGLTRPRAGGSVGRWVNESVGRWVGGRMDW
ncbi:hypothetical protein Vafri_22012 [Volvox africanus]|uniref:Uncharacterized protein n=1 Tax=Volvox africanus TaxID=51714 RepID=A0A8J4FB18_9CHLO|nr:hypothetical protein Vafri_22012 [Volvox africanus]